MIGKVGRFDIGLMWAKLMAIMGQVGVIQGLINSLMLIGIFYTTTVKPNIDIPLWMYLVGVVSGITVVVTFILSIGISGYYRFFNQQSAINEIKEELAGIRKELKESNNERNCKPGNIHIRVRRETR